MIKKSAVRAVGEKEANKTKKEAWIWIIGIAAVILFICALTLRKPELTLPERAVELKSGQLLCTDGTVWQDDGTSRITEIGKLSGAIPELDIQGKIPIDMQPYEFAAYISGERTVFIDNTGRVWKAVGEAEGRLSVEPFYIEEALPQTPADGVTVKLRGSEKLWIEVEKPDVELQPFFVVGVLLKDGWHNISKIEMETILYGENRRQYEAVIETPHEMNESGNVMGKYRADIYIARGGGYYYGGTLPIEHGKTLHPF